MWEDTTTDDTDADYWRGDFNNRGAASRVLFDPTASDTRPTFANVSGGESIITSGLVLNLDANNYTSGSTWTDTSGQDNNGTINGSTYNSENGGYFDFDGTNERYQETHHYYSQEIALLNFGLNHIMFQVAHKVLLVMIIPILVIPTLL